MHRRPLEDRLHRYLRRYPEEGDTVARILDVVRRAPRCFERDCWLGHITGSAWVVNRAGTHALLTHHRKFDRWLQLGGHSDGESDTLAVALREAVEESGLALEVRSGEIFDIDVHEIPVRGAEPAHDHLDLRFLMQVAGSDAFTVSAESHDLAWVPIDDLSDYTDEESVLRLARKYKRWQLSN